MIKEYFILCFLIINTLGNIRGSLVELWLFDIELIFVPWKVRT